jgi:hypothetical protein
MPVPKAAMDEDGLFRPREDEIGSPRKVPFVKTEAVAEGVCSSSDSHFRLAALGSNSAHKRPAFWGNRFEQIARHNHVAVC